MIGFECVSFYYPEKSEPALEEIDLVVDDGAFVLVIGDSGSGKSTLLRCINGLIPHFYGGRFVGDATVDGWNTKEHTVANMSCRVGFVFQDAFSQAVNKKVDDEIAFGLENLGLLPVTMHKRIEEVVDQLGISDLRDRDMPTLSGGERQKVAIGCALAMQPGTLVLDEPTSELDPNSADEVLNLLRKLNHDLGLTIIVSEHRIERVVQYADSIVYMEDGKAVHGSTGDILKEVDLTPPIVTLAKHYGWDPLPLSVKEARRFIDRSSRPSGRLEKERGQEMTLNNNFPLPSREGVRGRVEINRETLLDAHNLRFSYDGREVLKGVDLEIRTGEIVALMGRNGTGKTTLLKNLCGLLKPDSGEIERRKNPSVIPNEVRNPEKLVCEDNHHEALIGYVPQRPSSLLFAETVSDELKATLDLHKNKVMENRETRVARMLNLIRLADKSEIYPRDLSLGEQQRVAIGSVMVIEPELLILDEPTHGLDYRNKETLVDLLKDLATRGKGVVLATHDVELAAMCADRVVLLADGSIVIDAPAREALSESVLFSPQINKLFGGTVLTVEDVIGKRDDFQ